MAMLKPDPEATDQADAQPLQAGLPPTGRSWGWLAVAIGIQLAALLAFTVVVAQLTSVNLQRAIHPPSTSLVEVSTSWYRFTLYDIGLLIGIAILGTGLFGSLWSRRRPLRTPGKPILVSQCCVATWSAASFIVGLGLVDVARQPWLIGQHDYADSLRFAWLSFSLIITISAIATFIWSMRILAAAGGVVGRTPWLIGLGVVLVAGTCFCLSVSLFSTTGRQYDWVMEGSEHQAQTAFVPLIQGFRDPTLLQLPSTDQVYAVSCTTSDLCLATGTGLRNGRQGPTSELLISTDAGTSWTPRLVAGGLVAETWPTCVGTLCRAVAQVQHGAVLITVSATGAVSAHYLSLSAVPKGFTCPTITWCAAVSSNGAIEQLDTSSDGGLTWATHAIPTPNEVSPVGLVPLACTGPGRCIVVLPSLASQAPGSEQHAATVLVTSNGGASFVPASRPPGTSTVTSLSCPISTFCLATSDAESADHSNLFSSADGGITWTPTGTQVPWSSSGLPNYAYCFDASHCWVLANSRSVDLFASSDGGATWTPVTVPGNPPAIFVTFMSCASSSTCLLLNGYSGITRTDDGGHHWKVQNPLPSPRPISIAP